MLAKERASSGGREAELAALQEQTRRRLAQMQAQQATLAREHVSMQSRQAEQQSKDAELAARERRLLELEARLNAREQVVRGPAVILTDLRCGPWGADGRGRRGPGGERWGDGAAGGGGGGAAAIGPGRGALPPPLAGGARLLPAHLPRLGAAGLLLPRWCEARRPGRRGGRAGWGLASHGR